MKGNQVARNVERMNIQYWPRIGNQCIGVQALALDRQSKFRGGEMLERKGQQRLNGGWGLGG